MATFGYTTQGASNVYDGKTCACKFQCPGNGTATKITVCVNMDGDVTLGLGIYSDNAGDPNALLGSGSVAVLAADGDTWYDSSAINVSVSNGSYYWLAVNTADVGGKVYFDSGGAANQSAQSNDNALPMDDPFVESSFGTRLFSIYATYTAASTYSPKSRSGMLNATMSALIGGRLYSP